jgi:hypothetical protein
MTAWKFSTIKYNLIFLFSRKLLNMKKFNLVFLLLLVCTVAFPQTENPLLASLQDVKTASENSVQKMLTKQAFEVDAIADDNSTNLKKKKMLEYHIKNAAIEDAYNDLKVAVDMLITQLKGDMTFSNKKKVLRRINKGKNASKWYEERIGQVKTSFDQFNIAVSGSSKAVGLDEITGAFSAVVEIFTGSRDFRLEQIKNFCEQIEGLRLKSYYELSGGGGKDK